MSNLFLYIFHPNPGNAAYISPTMGTLLLLSVVLIAASFAIRAWRGHLRNAVTKKLSRLWSGAALWFGIIGVILVVSRVEGIQYIAMRFWWGVWIVALVAFALLQMRLFKSRHYEVLPTVKAMDPREKYLPGKKRR